MHLISTLLFPGIVCGHSWIEQITVIVNNTFAGNNSYLRGYVSRSEPGFTDSIIRYLLPPLSSSRLRIDESDLLCSSNQR